MYKLRFLINYEAVIGTEARIGFVLLAYWALLNIAKFSFLLHFERSRETCFSAPASQTPSPFRSERQERFKAESASYGLALFAFVPLGLPLGQRFHLLFVDLDLP